MHKVYIPLVLLILFGCKANIDKTSISGNWTLFKEQKGNKEVDLGENPTAVVLNLKENGYFIFYDKINDEGITESGVNKIQERFKGQYIISDGHLEMKHYVNDSLITEIYNVKDLSSEKLVLQEEKSGLLLFWKR